ncbi:MAG: hypothetical protein KGJ10_06655 [Acidobacteriota bacterium]|nr:hypothetical protein [Acidobacteriota bacterium]MDE3044491.1 hypothetical protein [Acidobacteriota bacterium]MDE3108188.1 hypothetical protein [Acidobacteriota bacterium]
MLTVAILGEITWTVYLGTQLPRTYVADHWDVAWVGLDVAEIGLLLGAAWAAWKRRAVLIAFAVGSATLLLVDAWFDLTTARRGDVTQSLIATFVIEVPAALAMLWVARRAARRVVRDVLHLELRSIVKLPLRGPESES